MVKDHVYAVAEAIHCHGGQMTHVKLGKHYGFYEEF